MPKNLPKSTDINVLLNRVKTHQKNEKLISKEFRVKKRDFLNGKNIISHQTPIKTMKTYL